MNHLRIGLGVDAHRFEDGIPLVLAGVDFPGEPASAVVSSGDGLDHYRRLVAHATPLLRPGAPILVQLHGDVHDLALRIAA